MLSEVERARKNPTVKLAYQIALALGCSLTELLEDGAVPTVSITRASERRTLLDPDTGVVRHGLRAELLDRHLELAWYELPARQTSGEMRAQSRAVNCKRSPDTGLPCTRISSDEDSALWKMHSYSEQNSSGSQSASSSHSISTHTLSTPQ